MSNYHFSLDNQRFMPDTLFDSLDPVVYGVHCCDCFKCLIFYRSRYKQHGEIICNLHQLIREGSTHGSK